jgi:hypothetical protein
VQHLEAVWANFRIEQVVRAGDWTMLLSGLHWIASLMTGVH